ncbi:MAG TPA: DNA polymerase/3'-5' exonuclease PolX [Vicinamibacterales bacterium]|nr:DNA polymerase/3'-5' exonuclease PolX [Vicinamibacterales bacterium]
MENIEIARIFEEIADLLDILGENPFRIRAYRNAARTVQALPTPVEVLLAEGRRLDELPGIGKDLAGKITEIVQTGTLPLLRELEARLPPGVVEIMRIPGIGPKRARELYEQLGVRSVADLEAAVKAGRLRELRGFGKVLEERILQGIAQHRAHVARFRLADADAYARPIVERLRRVSGVAQLEIAGSYRRRRETVGDLDILVAAADGEAVAEQFVTTKGVRQVLARGETKSSILLESGLQVDLRTVPAEAFGAALHYFTGSKAHNIAVRTLGVRRGLKINEYGIFRGRRRVGGRTEEEVFASVGLPWIPPELREDGGEIAAAREGRLPNLVRLEDLRGDLQMHTTYTDGKHSLAEMVEACRRRGYEYVAITDHTQAVRVAGGLTREGFRRQFREIERLQKTIERPVVLKGAEVDILEDGRLDLDEATLAELDVVVVSVHSKFNLTKAAMTKRIVRALSHPRVHILGHPTGRLLGRREPYPVDLEEVIKAARDHGVMLEINAQPDRLDLNDTAARMAKERGVKLVISTDAHSVDELACLRYGVDQARRGWCEAADIANTRPLEEFRKLLRK